MDTKTRIKEIKRFTQNTHALDNFNIRISLRILNAAYVSNFEYFLYELFNVYGYTVDKLAYEVNLHVNTLNKYLRNSRQDIPEEIFDSISCCYWFNYYSAIKKKNAA